MARVFRRGELREVTLIVLDDLGETHAYAVLGELDSRVQGWTPSPGAVYPALLSLVQAGLATTREDGEATLYRATDLGRSKAADARVSTRWPSLSSRAQAQDKQVAVGTVLDRFCRDLPARNRLLSSDKASDLTVRLNQLQSDITDILDNE